MTDRRNARPSGRRGAHCGGGTGGCCRARGRGRLVLGDVWRHDLPDVHTEHHHDNNDDDHYAGAIDLDIDYVHLYDDNDVDFVLRACDDGCTDHDSHINVYVDNDGTLHFNYNDDDAAAPAD